MSRIRRMLAAGGLAMIATMAAVLLPGFVSSASAQGMSQSSLPTTSTQWDPQTTNVPYLAWAGEELRLEKCFAAPGDGRDSVRGVGADFLLEDWSADSGQTPQFEPTTQNIWWSNTLDEPCVSEDIVSLFPGFARVEVDVTDPRGVLGLDSGSPAIKHQFLAGWMTLNKPTLTQMASTNFASTAQTEAASEMGDPSGNGAFNPGTKPGYLDVHVTGTIPLTGAWASLVGQSSVTLPDDWALLANKLATDDNPVDSQAMAANKWDISNDPTGDLGHVTQSPACDAVPVEFQSAPPAPAGTDSVDDCTGGGADGPFSTQFGLMSSDNSVGPFDPVRAADTLLPNGVLDDMDAPMPAARIDVTIAPNSGGATDISGVGSLAAADKTKTYSRDFLGPDGLPDNEYAPFYDQYIPATSAPGDASSGVDGGSANNFNGLLVNGAYHNWDIADTLISNDPTQTTCLEEARNPQTGLDAGFYDTPSGPSNVAIYTDNHGEAQAQYVPGLGYYFDSLLASGAAIPNANGGCDLQSLYQVAGGIGSASITATARYPFKPTDFADVASDPVSVSIASLWTKSLAAFPIGAGTENNSARVVTSHAQDIDGTPFGGELVCFFADSNAAGLSVFRGTVGGTNYGDTHQEFDPFAGLGAVCVRSDDSGNAAVEVLDGNGNTSSVIAVYENEGLLRTIPVSFAMPAAATTTTSTTTPTSAQQSSILPAAAQSPTETPAVVADAPASASVKAALKSIRTRVAFMRLVTPHSGQHHVVLKALSASHSVKIRLTLVEKLNRAGKTGSHQVRKTYVRTIHVRANHTVSINVPNSVIRASASLG
jgi:hypothetical protein